MLVIPGCPPVEELWISYRAVHHSSRLSFRKILWVKRESSLLSVRDGLMDLEKRIGE